VIPDLIEDHYAVHRSSTGQQDDSSHRNEKGKTEVHQQQGKSQSIGSRSPPSGTFASMGYGQKDSVCRSHFAPWQETGVFVIPAMTAVGKLCRTEYQEARFYDSGAGSAAGARRFAERNGLRELS
jgi:hypothetical protein